ncbi:MAG: ABC transporter permease [Dehalococcoidia bacterium]
MIRYRSLPVLAVRRMLGNWRLLSSVAVGTLVAAAILSATAVYADAIRDLGLRYALAAERPADLDVSVLQSNVPVTPDAYGRSVQRQDAGVAGVLGSARGEVVRSGASATFYPAPAGEAPDLTRGDRPRANLLFRSRLADHVTVVEGAFPEAQPADAEGPVDALVGADTAAEQGLAVGDVLDLYPFWDGEAAPVLVRVAGIATAHDADARYWGGGDALDAPARSWPTYLFYLPTETFFGRALAHAPTMAADYRNQYEVLPDQLNARVALPVANGLDNLARNLVATETRPTLTTSLTDVLRTFDTKLFFTRIPLLVVLLQVGGIVAYYLVMVSTMLVERQAAEIATLRSRGATTGQLLGQYGVEGLILAALATLVGPPLAAAVVSALGPTPAFAALAGGGPLPVHVGTAAYALAAFGALIAFASLMLPAWRATRTTVVEFKRSAARPRPTPVLLRYYVDVAAVLVLALVFWQLSRQEELFTRTLFGDTAVDPFLLATPAVFMLTVGIVFLRLFPPVLRGVAWAIGKTRSVAVLVGVRSLVRDPTHYTRLILLLMFATGVGMFGATFSATLAHSYADRAGYAAGADVRATGLLAVDDGDAPFLRAVEGVPADARTPVIRMSGAVMQGRLQDSVQVLGVEPDTFGDVAFFRDDFAATGLPEMLDTLQANSIAVEGPAIAPDVRQVGVWLQLPDIRGRVTIGMTLRDAAGRLVTRSVGEVRPEDPATEEWTFFSVDLEQPVTRFGGLSREAALTPPLELRALFFSPAGRIASQQGTVLVGPMLTTTAEPTAEGETIAPGLGRTSMAWPDAALLHDFTTPGFEIIQGRVPVSLEDRLRPVTDAPPGVEQAMRYEWEDAALSPSVRGLRVALDGEPAAVYLSRQTGQQLEVGVGSPMTLAVASRYVEARVAGLFDYFPTFDPASRDGMVVMDASRLATAATAGAADRAVGYTEAWFATSDLDATRAALTALEPRELVEREAVLAVQQEDPLIAAGWAGILAIAFGAVLLLSAIGFIVYSYLTAQQRALEFAILRTLGFSRAQVFSVVLFEHLFVIAAGMGLGTAVGLRIGRLMMGFLGVDEQGGDVVPPFIQQVSWTEVFVVWGILGTVFVATIAAVVALYLRLAVSRALRIGDV